MRAGDWCSQVPIRVVASRCCVDPSTVTRAYQWLSARGLIRRQDPGRDPGNPFQQATAVTEVRVPRELLVELSRAPNRPAARRAEKAENPADPRAARPAVAMAAGAGRKEPRATDQAPERPMGHLKYRDYQRIQGKFSAAEKAAYDRAWADSTGQMTFDPATQVTAEEQAHVRWQLYLRAKPPEPMPAAVAGSGIVATVAPRVATFAPPRQLSALDAARLRQRVAGVVAAADVGEVFRQVLWSVEEGALRRFAVALAVNVAVKKLREGAWTRPNRMPPNWLRMAAPASAAPESCVAA
jgi:hypothetical protein